MAMDARELDERQRETWRRGAQGWERRQGSLREKTAPVAQWLVEAIAPQPTRRSCRVTAHAPAMIATNPTTSGAAMLRACTVVPLTCRPF